MMDMSSLYVLDVISDFCEVRQHFAMLQEIAVEFICFNEIVPDVSAVGVPDISIKVVAVRRMSTFVDNLFRPLHRSYPAKVREALFGHYDLHRVFIAVDVRAHGHDAG